MQVGTEPEKIFWNWNPAVCHRLGYTWGWYGRYRLFEYVTCEACKMIGMRLGKDGREIGADYTGSLRHST